MKDVFITLNIMFGLLSGMSSNAQTTFVSMEPSNKNVILEEYTGVNCTWCPAGHKIANDLMHNNPGRVFSINIHQGGFANTVPDFRTDFGDALASQAGINAYPMGTVNRHVFSGSSMQLDRGDWSSRSTQIMGQSSYVNVAAKSVLDAVTRELTVNVQIYYTADAPVDANNINIALLQDNILGPQTGMNNNPNQIVGDKYNHQHMLRHLLTGQWGDEITTTSAGTLIDRTYSYIIPPHLRNVEYELAYLDAIVFITEGHKEIITGVKSEWKVINSAPVMKNLIEVEIYSSSPEILLNATVFNFTDEVITDLQFKYNLNDYPEIIHNYNKILNPMETDTVNSVLIPIVSGNTYNIKVTLTGYNGKEIVGGIPFEVIVKKTIADAIGNNFIFILATDRYASQTSFKFFDSNGNVINQDGNFPNKASNGITERKYEINFPTQGCYKLEVYDKGGDGINSGYGEGFIKFSDTEGNVIFFDDGKFGYQANYYINVGSSFLKNISNDLEITLFPNPVCDIVNIETDFPIISIEILNLQGQKIISSNKKEIDVSKLSTGVYLVNIKTDKGFFVKKFIKR